MSFLFVLVETGICTMGMLNRELLQIRIAKEFVLVGLFSMFRP